MDLQRAGELFEKAEAANDVGRYETAQSLAAQGIAFAPEAAELYASLARACLGLNQLPQAETHCREGLRLDPDNAWLLRILVLVTRLREDFTESTSVAKRLLQLAPHDSLSHIAAGRTFLQCGNTPEAVQRFQEAIRLDPMNDDAFSSLGICYLESGQPKMAEQQFRQALSLNPNNAKDLNNLGVSLQRQGKQKDAAVAFKAAVIVDPTCAVSKSNAKASIAAYLSVGGGLLLLYLFAKLMFVAGKTPAAKLIEDIPLKQQKMIAATIGIGVLLLFGFFTYGRRWLRKRDLLGADPQILEFYKTVCKDKDVK
ncbi:tetratricopeptide repeat protein [Mariniblastus fucicola]|uniref:Lipoprotein NlpI n=1 Tax=Mariniblastus fucicola TaxID=980251 RepID=A0A5B9P445_9BACT|nr:tetratricopeptide repeat protein [Mariniblastus fucicola]QEG21397.1 lipoprotein NlpI [Mariniblastus fucicola]